jgi:hypothetical protein
MYNYQEMYQNLDERKWREACSLEKVNNIERIGRDIINSRVMKWREIGF